MKLYEFAFTRSIRARWVLQELSVDFEPISVNLSFCRRTHAVAPRSTGGSCSP